MSGLGFTVLGYSTDDGSETERVWNSRDGVAPAFITLRSGAAGWHSGPDAYEGRGWTPPPGMRWIVDWAPGMGESGGVEIGWPGMPYLLDPEA